MSFLHYRNLKRHSLNVSSQLGIKFSWAFPPMNSITYISPKILSFVIEGWLETMDPSRVGGALLLWGWRGMCGAWAVWGQKTPSGAFHHVLPLTRNWTPPFSIRHVSCRPSRWLMLPETEGYSRVMAVTRQPAHLGNLLNMCLSFLTSENRDKSTCLTELLTSQIKCLTHKLDIEVLITTVICLWKTTFSPYQSTHKKDE